MKLRQIILLPVFAFITLLLSFGIHSVSSAEDLVVRIFVEKSEYAQGEDINFEIQVAQNGVGIPNAQVCMELFADDMETGWGACNLTDSEGFIYETLEYGWAIPNGFSGYLLFTVTAVYDEQEAYSEMPIPYGIDNGDDDDDDEEEADLYLEIITYDAVEFSQGDNITVGMTLTDNGYPVENAKICPVVTDEAGNILYDRCNYTNVNGIIEFQLLYQQHILTGYVGSINVWANVTANGGYAENSISIPYNAVEDAPLEIELFGPTEPIQQGSTEDIGIAGIVTSQGARVDGATISMQVNGQTFQTTTGTYSSGEFNWYWSNTTFPAGNHTVLVTVSKDGYQTATGEIPFTLLGDQYDYWVTMDAIQATYPPSTNVPFSGVLTLGGNPVADWIDIDVTYPNGTIETFINLSGDDGRFTLTLPSMVETGIYQLVVYYQANREQISQIYTWTVGATPTPTVTSEAPKQTQAPSECKIVEVKYPNPAPIGENIAFTGSVVCTNGEGEPVLQEGWYVRLVTPQNTPNAQTDQTGNFSITMFLDDLSDNEVFLVATDRETGWSRKVYWFGQIKIIVALEPDLRLSQTDYDAGELLEGELHLNPNYYDQGWDDGVEIIYQVVGPVGGAEQLYLFQSLGNYSYGIDSFYWQIPKNAEFGDYRITAFISGTHIQTVDVEENFWVNDIRHTNLDAFVEPGVDEWSSAILAGEFTDADGASIPDAEVRVIFQEKESPNREFTLTGRTDQDGHYEIDLESLDLFAGQGQDDPWRPRNWFTTVYADKEGYATGSTFLNVNTPTVSPYLEIIAVNPPLDALSKLTTGGINYTNQLPFDIEVTVQYNNIYDGGKLNLVGEGNWALSCVGGDTWSAPSRKAHLSVNGEELPEWNIHQRPLLHRRSWTIPGNIKPSAYYWYPRLETEMDAQQGFGQISTVRVSGDLFGYQSGDPNNPINPCNAVTYEPSPEQPPEWLMTAWSGVKVHVSLGYSKASVHYRLSPPTLGASGQAWVSPTDGKLSAEIRAGQATGYPLKNQSVKLSIIAKDLNTGAESDTQEISVVSNASTDDKGKIELPLTAVTNPCELEKKAQYFVKINGSDIEGEQKIPIELRCVEKLKFETEDDRISLVQAVDLTDYPPFELAAGKEAGVRVYYDVEGEIYQLENRPVQFDVKFELLQPGTNRQVVSQIKRVSLSETGVSVAWKDLANAPNQAGIGSVIAWENQPSGEEGRESAHIDFVFTPRQMAGEAGEFKIRITFDPNEVYGEKVEAEIDGTVHNMKTLRLVIVPVDIYNLDMGFVLEQTSFLHETYPLGKSNLILDPHSKIYESSQIPATCTSLTLWKEIACGVGRETGISTSVNDPVKVIAIVDSATWLQVNKAFLYAGGIGALGTYDAESWDSATNNVVVIRYPENVPNTSAHEIGHAYGLEPAEQYKQHPPHGLTVDGLILKNGQILDLSENLGNKDPSSRKNMQNIGLGGVTEMYDLMGNAGYYLDTVNDSIQYSSYQQSWVVFKTYNTLLQALKDPVDEDIFFVQGVIGLDGLVHLDPVIQTIGLPTEPSTTGDYELQLQDSGGNILYSTRFGYLTKPGLFNIQLPYTPGVGRLVVLQGGAVVGELVRSPSAPEIILSPLPEITLSPLPEIDYEDTTLNLSWTANDDDGDPLFYSIGYNCDGMDVWVPLAANLTEPNYTLNLMQIPEGTCTLKVTVSDGLNSKFAVSESFTGTQQGPLVQIAASDDPYPAGEPVLISGQAYDLSDGAIPPENFYWTSDRDGDLGTGNPLSAILSEGSHNLTLYVLDSRGNASGAMVTIQVVEEPLDQPTSTPPTNSTATPFVFIIGLLVLAGILLGGGGLVFWLVYGRKRKAKLQQPMQFDRPGVIQDGQGRYWYQDPNTRAWYYWDGRAWQIASHGPTDHQQGR